MMSKELIPYLYFPDIKPLLENIINIVKIQIVDKYRENENNLRISYDDEKTLKKEINNYFEQQKQFDDFTNNIIHKGEILKSNGYNNQKEKEELCNLLINDYFTIFFINNINNRKNKKIKKEENKICTYIDKIEIIIKFLNLLANIRNKIINNFTKDSKPDINIALRLAKVINWIESYSEEIILILQIFMKLFLMIPQLYEYLVTEINKKEVKYKIEKNKEHFSIINEVFFVVINSIVKIINTRDEIYELSENNLHNLLNLNKEILRDVLLLENNLNLYSEEVLILKEIIKIIVIHQKFGII